MDYDLVRHLIAKKFSELHPKEKLPEWFDGAVTLTGEHDKNGNWEMSYIVFKKQELGENRYWKIDSEGRRKLMIRKPETGKEFVVLHYSVPDSEIITIFKAKVTDADLSVEVLLDTDLDTINGADLEWEGNGA